MSDLDDHQLTSITIHMWKIGKNATESKVSCASRGESPRVRGRNFTADVAVDAEFEQFMDDLSELLWTERNKRLLALKGESERLLDEAVALRQRVLS